MKVAVILFGNMRTYMSCSKSFNNINEDCSFDYYIHTWDDVERKTSSHKEILKSDNKVNQDDIKHNYKESTIKIEKSINIDSSKDYFNRFYVDGAESMYESISSSAELLSGSNKEYDLVIITRPDIYFKSKLDLQAIKEYLSIYPRNAIFRAGYFTPTNSKSVNYMDSWGASDCLMVCNMNVAILFKELKKNKVNLKLPYVKWVENQLDYFLLDNRIKSLYLDYRAPYDWCIMRANGENSSFKVDILKEMLVVGQSFKNIVKLTLGKFR
ncbi:hypothetical protein AB6D89_20160 [Vibrio splendidus]